MGQGPPPETGAVLAWGFRRRNRMGGKALTGASSFHGTVVPR